MTGFMLKVIALVTMVLDHIKYGVPATRCFVTQYFGRISFPLFAFLITEGLVHTKNRKKYITRLFIFALISQIPFMMFRSLVADKFLLNIMFTFLFAIVGIIILEFLENNQKLHKFFKFIIMTISLILILALSMLIPVDYSWYGIATVWLFYILRDNKIARTIMYIILVMLYYISLNIPKLDNINLISALFTMLPGIIILFYNGEKGKSFKYFFYVFYPVHMLLIYLISLI